MGGGALEQAGEQVVALRALVPGPFSGSGLTPPSGERAFL
jgi:hypothetical protein